MVGGRGYGERRRRRLSVMGGKQRSEGEGGPESEGEVRGGRGRLRGVARKSGRLPRRSRRWPALFGRAPRLASAYWQRKKRTRGGGGGGGLGRPGGGARPALVGGTGKAREAFCSVLFNSVLFFFYLILLPLF